MSPHVTEALDLYLQHPLDDGAVVLLLPGEPAPLEVEPAPDPAALAARVTALVPARVRGPVVLAVARSGSRPRPADLLLWTELWSVLAGTSGELQPLELLPAAA